MKMFRKDEGFTLVELMVVVLIIGILVAIAIPIFNAAKASAQQKTCFANERTVEGAYQTYLADGNDALAATDTWADLASLLTGTSSGAPYLERTPVCPAGGAYAVAWGTNQGSVTVSCEDTGTVTGHGHF